MAYQWVRAGSNGKGGTLARLISLGTAEILPVGLSGIYPIIDFTSRIMASSHPTQMSVPLRGERVEVWVDIQVLQQQITSKFPHI